MSGIVVLFLLIDGAIKLIPLDIVVQTSEACGIPADLASTLGVLTLAGTILYAIPATSVLGAIWGGLYLRDERVRALITFARWPSSRIRSYVFRRRVSARRVSASNLTDEGSWHSSSISIPWRRSAGRL